MVVQSQSVPFAPSPGVTEFLETITPCMMDAEWAIDNVRRAVLFHDLALSDETRQTITANLDRAKKAVGSPKYIQEILRVIFGWGPLTLEDLLSHDMHLVTYEPRYGGGPDARVGVFIAGNLCALAQMADAMTDSGDSCQHIESMLYGTPYFPWGVGATLEAAVAAAMARVHTVPRDLWFGFLHDVIVQAPEAYPEIDKQYCDWGPLPSLDVLIAAADETLRY